MAQMPKTDTIPKNGWIVWQTDDCGFCNARMSLETLTGMAIALERGIMMPEKSRSNPFDSVEWKEIFDIPNLSRYVPLRMYQSSSEWPSDTDQNYPQWNMVHRYLELGGTSAEAARPAFNNTRPVYPTDLTPGKTMFFGKHERHRCFSLFDRAIHCGNNNNESMQTRLRAIVHSAVRWNPDIYVLLRHLTSSRPLALSRSASAVPSSGPTYIAMHIRRTDFRQTRPESICSVEDIKKQVHGLISLADLDSRNDCGAAALSDTDTRQPSTGSSSSGPLPLYLATDDDHNQTVALRRELSKNLDGRDVLTLDDLIDPKMHYVLKKRPHVRPIMDMIMCAESALFFGTRMSTFSVSIDRERGHRLGTSVTGLYINAPRHHKNRSMPLPYKSIEHDPYNERGDNTRTTCWGEHVCPKLWKNVGRLLPIISEMVTSPQAATNFLFLHMRTITMAAADTRTVQNKQQLENVAHPMVAEPMKKATTTSESSSGSSSSSSSSSSAERTTRSLQPVWRARERKNHRHIISRGLARLQLEFLPKYTKTGFSQHHHLPEPLKTKVLDLWKRNRSRATSEHWEKNVVELDATVDRQTKANAPVSLYLDIRNMENGVVCRELEAHICKLLEEWIGGRHLSHHVTYGVREYTRGAVLKPHLDRFQTHAVSAIVNLYQTGMDEPWGLQVVPHGTDEEEHVFMEPGDILLYESATIIHGREYPLLGDGYAGVFLHYYTDEWKAEAEKVSKMPW